MNKRESFNTKIYRIEKNKRFVLLISFLIIAIDVRNQERLTYISAKMEAKTLVKKEYLTVKGEVFFDAISGKLATYFYKPEEQITLTNFNGEYSQYFVQRNSVIQKMNPEFSSKNSIFYYFANGKTNDLDLASNGFKLSSTNNKDGMIITTWIPGKNTATQAGKIELVHENKLPIYMGIYDKKNKITEKIYYHKYQNYFGLNWPVSITEISYEGKDSVITKRTYSDFKFNNEVEKTYLNYRIPANAKPVKE